MKRVYHTRNRELTAQDVLDAVEANLAVIEDSEPDFGIESDEWSEHWKCNYRTPAWEFTRLMFQHPANWDLGNEDAHIAADRIERLLEDVRDHLPHSYLRHTEAEDVWMEAFQQEGSRGVFEDPYEDFLACWRKMERSPFHMALARAIESEKYQDREFFGAQWANKRRRKPRLMLAWIRELSQLVDEGVFHLSQRAVARGLDTDQPMVSRWLDEAQSAGLLRCVHEDYGPGTAKEYTWTGP